MTTEQNELRSELDKILSGIIIENIDGEVELGLINEIARNERYIKTIEQILDSSSSNTVLLVHSLDTEFELAPACALDSLLLNRTFARIVTLPELRQINDQLEDY